MAQPIFGKTLRVDLTGASFSRESVARADLEQMIGGRGLGATILYREVEKGADPYGPENRLVFTTGPLVGTRSPGNSKIILNTKSPLTGLYLFSVASGSFGTELRRAGFDGLVVEGKAKSPVYLYIRNGVPSLRSAAHLWDCGTFATQELIREELRGSPAILCIGPAGAHGVSYAAAITERRALGRGGGGAVMGSKNLKAIVVHGDQPIGLADDARFSAAVRRAFHDLNASAPMTEAISRFGSPAMVEPMNEFGIYPVRNFQHGGTPHAAKISGEELRRAHLVKDRACSIPCPVKCSKYFAVKAGPRAGAFSEGPEYETLYAFGGTIGNFDLPAIIEIDALCDDLGLDTISTGASIAFAMECYEKGILTAKDMGGLDLRFGNVDLVPSLIKDIAFGRGFGLVLGGGTRRMAQEFGRGSEVFAMHCKGMELGAYDPRSVKGMALVYAAGPRGGCHHAGGFPIFSEVLSGKFDRLSEGKEKSALVASTRNRRVSTCDSFPMCSFVAMGVTDSTMADLISAATGFDVSPQEVYRIGERISTIERMFNCREGVRREDDTLPARLLAERPGGTAAGAAPIGLDRMLDDYYAHLGWDLQTGLPRQEKLEELGLSWMA